MTNGLHSDAGIALLRQLTSLGESVLRAVDEGRFVDVKEMVTEGENRLAKVREEAVDEAILNDLYIIGLWLRLLSYYGAVWEQIVGQQFAASWISLQNAIDAMRAIKRLAEMNLCFLEEQLIHLERAYPYTIFASIGAVASRIDCSICKKDIDSPECIHRRGHLYAGRIAVAIVTELAGFDHVSMVTNPVDKRCVMTIEDTSEQFKLVRYISGLIAKRQLVASKFDRIEFTQRRIPNPGYQKMSRNDLCFCGSGKKFKCCCVERAYIDGPHANVLVRRESSSTEALCMVGA